MGIYRLWRDLGYAFGAVVAGVVVDAFGLDSALWLIAGLTFVSGTVVALRMRETSGCDRPASSTGTQLQPPSGNASGNEIASSREKASASN